MSHGLGVYATCMDAKTLPDRATLARIKIDADGRPITTAYYRVSADPSQGGRSIGSQQTYARKTADERGLYLPPELEFDETRSASMYGLQRGVEREAWALYLEAVRLGLASVAILPDVYRGMREFTAYQDLIRVCILRKTPLIADGREYDLSTETDAFIVGLDVLKGAGEASRISGRVKRGVAGSVAQGRPPVGKVPFGYYRPPRKLGEKVYQVPDRVNARLVRAGARYVLATSNASRVARRWADVTGKPWTQAMVKDVLLNPAVIGRRTVSTLVTLDDGTQERQASTVEGNWPAILDTTTYYALQELFSDPKRRRSNGPKPSQLCTSVVRCGGKCGKPLRHQKAKHGKPKPIYTCSRGCVSLDVHKLDEYVADAVKAVLAAEIRDTIVEALRDDLPAAEDDTHRREVEAARVRLEAAQRERDEFSAAAADSGLKPAEVVKAMVSYGAAVEAAETALRAVAGVVVAAKPDRFMVDAREYVRLGVEAALEAGLASGQSLPFAVMAMMGDEIYAAAEAYWRSAELERRREWVRNELDARLLPVREGRIRIDPLRGWDWVGDFRPGWAYQGLRRTL